MINRTSSRWATDEEAITSKDIKVVKPGTEITAAGIPVGSNGKNILVDAGSMHTLVIGSTGSGKTQSITMPAINTMIDNGESMVLLDPQGELYSGFGNKLKENDYNTIVINYKDAKVGNHYNPIKLIADYYRTGEMDKAIVALEQLSGCLIKDSKPEENRDPFWENSAADYFQGLVMASLENNLGDKVTIKNIFDLSNKINENNETFKKFKKATIESGDKRSNKYLNTVLNAPTETRKSIISVFEEKIRRFILEDTIVEMMGATDFKLNELYEKKTCIFIIFKDNTIYNSLYSAIIYQIYNYLFEMSEKNTNNIRYNFILDEFGLFAPIKNFSSILTQSRSKNIRFTLLVTSFEDIINTYGVENAENIKANCGIIIYLLSNRLSTLEEISKLCGNVYEETMVKPLVSIEELQRMNQWEAIILKVRCLPYKTKLIPNYLLGWNTDEKSTLAEHLKIDNNVNLFDVITANVTDDVKPSNIDDLIRRIDNKIEELEKEEVKEEQKEVIANDLKDINLKELSDRKIVIEKTTITIYPKD